MFEDRANWIGIALLIACGISAGTMLGYIEAGDVARFSGPAWLGWTIAIVFIGLMIFSIVQVRRGKTLGDDIRSERRKWWRRDKE